MDLREPKRKRVGSHIKPQQPFPISIESENNTLFGNDIWPLFIGNFTGDSVVVCNPEEMVSIYTMGFFGKGSFSRGYPSFEITKKGIPPIIKERQWKRRKLWMDKFDKTLTGAQTQDKSNESNLKIEKNKPEKCNDSEQDENIGSETTSMEVEETKTTSMEIEENISDFQNDVTNKTGLDQLKYSLTSNSDTSEHNVNMNSKVLVLADSDNEDIENVIRNPQPHLEDEKIRTVIETLNLTLEEAFFLSYALGCLHVIDMSGNAMTLRQLWATFCEVKPDFIELYVAYHHFRAKGWVVKTGHKFGGDFLLYKQGPAFYHASYIVLVEKVNSQLERAKNTLTWTKLHGLNRLAESSGKDIITCQVLFPDSLTSEDLMSPKALPKYQVNELLTKRWISSQEREEKET